MTTGTPASAAPVALVTGAARRIGAGIARRLHADGFALALHYRGSGDAMHALVAELDRARAGSVVALQADLADVDALAPLVSRAIERFGRLDGLVNNASAFFPAPVGTATAAQWDTLFAVNARAPFLLAQAAAPHLEATGGAIVNLADIHALHPRADLAAYAASKAALLGVNRALAVALGPAVRVNAVAPGAILWPEEGIDDALREAMLARTPLGRIGTVEEVAGVVAWLLRDARYVTGQVLRVDGGRAM